MIFSHNCVLPYKVVALLCVGLYPNVCYHKEKRHLLTMDGRGALIHKSSINIVNKDPHFPSPYFVFGEKVVIVNQFKISDSYM